MHGQSRLPVFPSSPASPLQGAAAAARDHTRAAAAGRSPCALAATRSRGRRGRHGRVAFATPSHHLPVQLGFSSQTTVTRRDYLLGAAAQHRHLNPRGAPSTATPAMHGDTTSLHQTTSLPARCSQRRRQLAPASHLPGARRRCHGAVPEPSRHPRRRPDMLHDRPPLWDRATPLAVAAQPASSLKPGTRGSWRQRV